MIKKCMSCGGEDFIDGVELIDTGEHSKRVANLRIEADPGAILFKDRRYSEVEVYVCADCGFVHSFAADLHQLLEGRSVRDGEPLKKKEVKIQWKNKNNEQ